MKRISLGVINIMPHAQEYAKLLAQAFAEVGDLVELQPIRLASHVYRSSGALDAIPCFREQARRGIDLLLVTGAPVEHLAFDDIHYWQELREVFTYAREQRIPVLGLCFGGLAVAKFFGMEKRLCGEKVFGVYRVEAGGDSARYIGAGRSHVDLALSTWALLDAPPGAAQAETMLRPILHHPALGPVMLATPDHAWVAMLGHPEYTVETLRAEWRRDRDKGLAYADRFTAPDLAAMGAQLGSSPVPILANWVRSHLVPQASQGAAA